MAVLIFTTDGPVSLTIEPVRDTCNVKRVAVEPTMVRAVAKVIDDMPNAERQELCNLLRDMVNLSATPQQDHSVADVIPFPGGQS